MVRAIFARRIETKQKRVRQMQLDLHTEAATAVAVIQAWYQSHCNGTWEHYLGIEIETTDNPGWLLTFKEMSISDNELAGVIGELLRKYGSQVTKDGKTVRVFARSLQECLVSSAVLIELSK
jgi:immunity protein 53 of polymorphic toxin system